MFFRCLWMSLAVHALTSLATARPIIPGYERFHSDKPSVSSGAILYSELGCANCHDKVTNIPRRIGPTLQNLPKRVERNWVRKFLLEPHKASEGTTMPDVLGSLPDAQRQKAAEDLLAWLSTLQTKQNFSKPRHGNAGNGKVLFESKGCAACHVGGQKLPDLKAKTSFAALNAFLQKTDSYRPDGRMPHFSLNSYDAGDVAAYLLDFKGSDPRLAKSVSAWPKPSKDAVARGLALAKKLQCANCHDLPGLKPSLKVAIHKTAFMDLPSHPKYTFDKIQEEAIREFLGAKAMRLGAEPTLASLNCYACHSRNSIGGPDAKTEQFFTGDKSLGDSGRIPPPLTEVGHKLQPGWMEKVFRGDKKIRPYLRTQMPTYRTHAKELTALLQKADQRPPNRLLSEKPDLQAGYKLLGTFGGYNCITCHDWGGKKSLGIRGLDLQTSGERLRKEWFRDYLLNPASYRPGTLMPSFWPDGKASIQDVLGGTTGRQLDAIWAAVESKAGEPPGFPSHASKEYELVPVDRPIVQRTFFKGIGTKAILVGFPGGINLGYDSSTAQPKLLWKGRFMDAYGTWFVRFAPFESPLGKEVFQFKAREPGVFHGYQLEEDGSPTFLGEGTRETYRVQEGKLLRIVSPDDRKVAHPEGVKVEARVEGRVAIYTYSF